MSKKLFVGNLPFDVNDADLFTVLGVAGAVASAKIVINKKTGRSKGYGFVEMESDELAQIAVKKFEGATLNERPLTVQLASLKQEAQEEVAENVSVTEAQAQATTQVETQVETQADSNTVASASPAHNPSV